MNALLRILKLIWSLDGHSESENNADPGNLRFRLHKSTKYLTLVAFPNRSHEPLPRFSVRLRSI